MEKTYYYQPKPQIYELSEDDFFYLATTIKENSSRPNEPWDTEFDEAINDFILNAGYEVDPPSDIVDNMILDLIDYYFNQFLKTYVFEALVSIRVKAGSKEEAQKIFDKMHSDELGEYASVADWGEPKLLIKEKCE